MSKLPLSGSAVYKEDDFCPPSKTVPATGTLNGHREPSIRIQTFSRLRKLGERKPFNDHDCEKEICACLWAHIHSDLREIEKRAHHINSGRRKTEKKNTWNANNELLEKLREKIRRCPQLGCNAVRKKSLVWIMRPRLVMRISKTNINSKCDTNAFNSLHSQHKLSAVQKSRVNTNTNEGSKTVLKSDKDYYNECRRLTPVVEPPQSHTKSTATAGSTQKPKLSKANASASKATRRNSALRRRSASSFVSESAEEVFFALERKCKELQARRQRRSTHVLYIEKKFDCATAAKKKQPSEPLTFEREIIKSNGSMLPQCNEDDYKESGVRLRDFEGIEEAGNLEAPKHIASKDIPKHADKLCMKRPRERKRPRLGGHGGGGSSTTRSRSKAKNLGSTSKTANKARKPSRSRSALEAAAAKKERQAARRRLKRTQKARHAKNSMTRKESLGDMAEAFDKLFREPELVAGAGKAPRTCDQKSLMTLSNGAFTITYHRPMPPKNYTPNPAKTLDNILID